MENFNSIVEQLRFYSPVLTPIILFVSAIITYRIFSTSIAEVSPSARISNIDTYFKGAYTDRKFSTPIIFHEKTVSTISEAKNLIKRRFQDGDELEENQSSSHEQKLSQTEIIQKLLDFREKAVSSKNEENKVAYEISIGIQQAGIMAMIGGIPLPFVLASHAIAIVEDWILCSKLVAEIRKEHHPEEKAEQLKSDDERTQYPQPFARRHGEWMAFLAALYVRKTLGITPLVEAFQQVCCDGSRQESVIKDKIDKIMKSDPFIVANSVRKDIKRISRMKYVP